MGEEVQKPEEEKKKAEEEQKPAAGDEKKGEESKEAPPPPPPPEVVLRVFMHCEGCARKVRRCLKDFDGVEDVVTDCKTHKVVVKGDKVDPMKVLERVQKKSHRKVELLSPVPKPPAEEEAKKPEKEEPPKPEEKKDEPPPVITVVLKVHMHCEACAQEIRKRILRMKGVESAVSDLKSSEVTVKGTFSATELLDYVHKKTGKYAIIVKQDPDPKKEEDNNGKDGKKDGNDGEKKEEKKPDEGGDKQEPTDKPEDIAAALEMRKNEYNYYYHPANYQLYPPRYAAEAAYPYPPPLPSPQMFSDENPNACIVM